MTNQKPQPCPTCQNGDNVTVYKYDSGRCHVECIKCNYLGPSESSVGAAIRSHNVAVTSKNCGGK